MWTLFVFTTVTSMAMTTSSLADCQQQFIYQSLQGDVTKAYCQTFFGDRVYLVMPRDTPN